MRFDDLVSSLTKEQGLFLIRYRLRCVCVCVYLPAAEPYYSQSEGAMKPLHFVPSSGYTECYHDHRSISQRQLDREQMTPLICFK